jgi:hypothetical protein
LSRRKAITFKTAFGWQLFERSNYALKTIGFTAL